MSPLVANLTPSLVTLISTARGGSGRQQRARWVGSCWANPLLSGKLATQLHLSTHAGCLHSSRRHCQPPLAPHCVLPRLPVSPMVARSFTIRWYSEEGIFTCAAGGQPPHPLGAGRSAEGPAAYSA